MGLLPHYVLYVISSMDDQMAQNQMGLRDTKNGFAGAGKVKTGTFMTDTPAPYTCRLHSNGKEGVALTFFNTCAREEGDTESNKERYMIQR